MKFKKFVQIGFIPTMFSISACNNSSEEATGTAPLTYVFESRFQQDEDSVAYPGQTLRQLLISDLSTYIGGLQEKIEMEASFDPSKVEGNLLAFYEFDSDTLGQNDFLLSSDPDPLQEVYDDVASGKDLAGKVAGNDNDGANDHKDWSKDFVGWTDEGISESGGSLKSPDGLLRAFFATIANNASLQANGDDSRKELKTHQTASGQDLQQLTQKFLLGALAFSQGIDDYLDEGLESDNVEQRDDAYSTELEHAWDEAFGYFGAARDYLLQEKKDIADGVQSDANEDDKIDLLSEYNFGASVNAAKRDNGAKTESDLVGDAMNAFLEGRFLISNGGSDSEIALQAQAAGLAWERALSATAIHYVNELLVDQESLGGDEYSFDDHSKHWSELKGFALAFQFNPNSPLKDDDFQKLHKLIGDHPVLSEAGESEQEKYIDSLKEARSILKESYDFAADDVKSW